MLVMTWSYQCLMNQRSGAIDILKVVWWGRITMRRSAMSSPSSFSVSLSVLLGVRRFFLLSLDGLNYVMSFKRQTNWKITLGGSLLVLFLPFFAASCFSSLFLSLSLAEVSLNKSNCFFHASCIISVLLSSSIRDICSQYLLRELPITLTEWNDKSSDRYEPSNGNFPVLDHVLAGLFATRASTLVNTLVQQRFVLLDVLLSWMILWSIVDSTHSIGQRFKWQRLRSSWTHRVRSKFLPREKHPELSYLRSHSDSESSPDPIPLIPCEFCHVARPANRLAHHQVSWCKRSTTFLAHGQKSFQSQQSCCYLR